MKTKYLKNSKSYFNFINKNRNKKIKNLCVHLLKIISRSFTSLCNYVIITSKVGDENETFSE